MFLVFFLQLCSSEQAGPSSPNAACERVLIATKGARKIRGKNKNEAKQAGIHLQFVLLGHGTSDAPEAAAWENFDREPARTKENAVEIISIMKKEKTTSGVCAAS